MAGDDREARQDELDEVFNPELPPEDEPLAPDPLAPEAVLPQVGLDPRLNDAALAEPITNAEPTPGDTAGPLREMEGVDLTSPATPPPKPLSERDQRSRAFQIRHGLPVQPSIGPEPEDLGTQLESAEPKPSDLGAELEAAEPPAPQPSAPLFDPKTQDPRFYPEAPEPPPAPPMSRTTRRELEAITAQHLGTPMPDLDAMASAKPPGSMLKMGPLDEEMPDFWPRNRAAEAGPEPTDTRQDQTAEMQQTLQGILQAVQNLDNTVKSTADAMMTTLSDLAEAMRNRNTQTGQESSGQIGVFGA